MMSARFGEHLELKGGVVQRIFPCLLQTLFLSIKTIHDGMERHRTAMQHWTHNSIVDRLAFASLEPPVVRAKTGRKRAVALAMGHFTRTIGLVVIVVAADAVSSVYARQNGQSIPPPIAYTSFYCYCPGPLCQSNTFC